MSDQTNITFRLWTEDLLPPHVHEAPEGNHELIDKAKRNTLGEILQANMFGGIAHNVMTLEVSCGDEVLFVVKGADMKRWADEMGAGLEIGDFV